MSILENMCQKLFTWILEALFVLVNNEKKKNLAHDTIYGN